MLKCVAISDTHNLHKQLELPEADVLIHSGDFCIRGTGYEAMNFAEWFVKQPHKHKIVIAGNHDLCLESNTDFHEKLFGEYENVHYLFNSSVEINGVKFWGSPYVPYIWGAFNLYRKDLPSIWNKIPNDIDVLITHGPPFERLDLCFHGQRVGCENLQKKVNEIKPKFHVFGHIHEQYGMDYPMDGSDRTTFINACSTNLNYKLVNKPVEFEVENNSKKQ